MQYSKYYRIIITLFCMGMGSSLTAQTVYPGLYNSDGSLHEVHIPNPVTGNTINILDYDVDLADSDKDDRPAILLALQAAQFGDEIFFPDGTYNFNSSSPYDSKAHLVLKNGVNLRGESRQGTIFLSKYGDKTIDRFLKMRGSENIVIANLTVTANFSGQFSTDVSVNNPDAGGPTYSISIEDDNGWPSSNILMDSVKCSIFRRMGVRLSNSHDVVLKNSYFSDATDVAGGGAGYGISIQGDGDQDNDSKWNLVDSCEFIGPYIRHGVILQYASHNNLVQNNYCNDNRYDAIDLHGEDEYLNEIYKNTTENITTGAGVGVGNTGSTHDASGPYNYIHENHMINCREGVKVYLGSPNTRIENNVITQSGVYEGKGVYILNGPGTIIKGNRIHDNSGTNFTGIYLKYDYGTEGKGAGNPRNVQIIENQIHDNPYGMRIYNGEGIVLEDNVVQNNTISDIYISSSVTISKLLTTLITGSGSIEMDPPGGVYPEDSEVTVTAMRAANWEFSHWEGALSGSENPTTLMMDSSKSVTAVFIEKLNSDEVALIGQIVGNGQIYFEPPGGIYARGTSVQIFAEPDSTWKFSQWSGTFSGMDNPLQVTADQNFYFTANFESLPVYSIFYFTQGLGNVSFDPPGGAYIEGTIVSILAVPEEGWEFSSWGGNLSGNENPIEVTVEGDLAVMANFIQSTGITSSELLPKQTTLYQNYPNPFNPSSTIKYDMAQSGPINILIYDVVGQQVYTLSQNHPTAGKYQFTWSGTDQRGNRLPSGIYFLSFRTKAYFKTIKMMLLE